MTTQKITLLEPIDGYEAEAEIRPAVVGDHFMNANHWGAVHVATGNHGASHIILTPKRQRAEVRRYWATVKATRKRFMVVRWYGNDGVFSVGGTPYTESYFTDITPIDPEFLNAPPVPEKDWWYGREKPREGVNDVLVWNGEAWLRRYVSNIQPCDIWRYQPPAPSVTRTEVGEESEASNG